MGTIMICMQGSLILLLLACTYSSNAHLQRNSDSWMKTVQEYNKNFFIQRLGWDPLITLYYDQHKITVINDSCTVYCHGWGESQTAILYRQALGLLPGTAVSFNFFDAVENGVPDFRKASFAQTNDIKALILILKLLDEAECNVIHLIGYSRGGGVVANTIRRLVCYDNYVKFFKKAGGISKTQAESIVRKISAGTVILDCPLIDARIVTKQRVPALCGFIDCVILPLATLGKYAPWKDQAIYAAPFLKNFNLLIHFQYGDRIVSNEYDEIFYTLLSSPTTHLVLGNDGGHFHQGQTLSRALNAFRKKYNGPYYDQPARLKEGELLLENSQPENVAQYIEDFYDRCKNLQT